MTPDLLPWLAAATQYSGLATVLIGLILVAQTWLQSSKTQRKFSTEIGKVRTEFIERLGRAEQREDERHGKLEQKQNDILAMISDKLHTLEKQQLHMELSQNKALGGLAERMAGVEAEVHAMRNGRNNNRT